MSNRRSQNRPKKAKYGTPPLIFHQKFYFYQNDSEWPEMDFKHNFNKTKFFVLQQYD